MLSFIFNLSYVYLENPNAEAIFKKGFRTIKQLDISE